jgi:hypothetical protein
MSMHHGIDILPQAVRGQMHLQFRGRQSCVGVERISLQIRQNQLTFIYPTLTDPPGSGQNPVITQSNTKISLSAGDIPPLVAKSGNLS